MENLVIKEGFNDEEANLIYNLEKELTEEESFANEAEGKKFLEETYSLEKIRNWRSDFVFTFWDNEDFLGFGRAKKDGWITHISIDKKHQGKGFGGRMLSILEEKLKVQGFKEIYLNSRPEVLKFYTKYGWVAKEDKPINYHGILLIPMKKEIYSI